MTRISAGNTLTNQYAPPFVVSNNVTTNWQLRWNATLLAFEAFDPDENIVVAGFTSIQQQLFSNVTNQQVFVVPWAAASEQSIYATINGVKQHTDTYSISAGTSTTSITLGGPATGDVEFIGMQASSGASVQLLSTSGDGSTTDFALGWLAPSEQSLLVTIDGLRQHTDVYSIASNASFTDTTLSFATAPGASYSSVTTIDNAGTGYTIGDLLLVSGGTFTSQAIIRADAVAGGTITGASVINGGSYTVLPANPVSVTGPGNDDATFTLATDQNIEVVGITTTGETPASPVNGANIFGLDTATVFGLFASKTQTGENQVLNFKSLEEGTNVTITDNTNRLTIAATQPTFANLGSGTSVAVAPGTTDPLQLRVFKTKLDADTAEGGLAIAVDSGGDGGISIVRNFGYVGTSSNDYNMGAGERIAGLNSFTIAKTITLPAVANIRAGETITIKDEIGGATASLTVTVDTVGAETIDGAGSIVGINSAWGYVTLYFNGTNFYKIAEG